MGTLGKNCKTLYRLFISWDVWMTQNIRKAQIYEALTIFRLSTFVLLFHKFKKIKMLYALIQFKILFALTN